MFLKSCVILYSLNIDFSNFVTQSDLANQISSATVDGAMLAGTGLEYNSATGQLDIDDTVVTTAKLSQLMNTNFSIPSLSPSSSGLGSVNIVINAGVGTDPYALGRTVQQALNKYNTISK
jgi:hypothetical protein